MFATMRAATIGFAIATASVALVAGAAMAQTTQQWQWRQGGGGVPESVQIDACTALINSGRYGGKDLRLDPTDADAYWRRHLCRNRLGGLVGALADHLTAKRLDPRVDRRQ